jgi:hypothetical protein
MLSGSRGRRREQKLTSHEGQAMLSAPSRGAEEEGDKASEPPGEQAMLSNSRETEEGNKTLRATRERELCCQTTETEEQSSRAWGNELCTINVASGGEQKPPRNPGGAGYAVKQQGERRKGSLLSHLGARLCIKQQGWEEAQL